MEKVGPLTYAASDVGKPDIPKLNHADGAMLATS